MARSFGDGSKPELRVGLYDHLNPVTIPMDMDALADLLVKANYGVQRFLSALIRARKRSSRGTSSEGDRLMSEIERLLEEGEF
ncbi:MAG: hypothetical protein WC797_00260 [Candidatus Paceibacterota bacterium]|jgi:hypothetical protein